MPAWLPLAMMGASAVAQGIRGISQGKQAKDLKKAYDRAESEITPIGPEMQSYMNRLSQQERFMRAGTDAASQFAKRATANALAQTNNSLVRAGGGANTIGNLLRGQQGAGNAYANIAANASGQANQMLQYQGALTQHLNELNYRRQRERRNIAMDRWAAMKQDSMNNLNALYGIGAQMATMMPESMWGGGQGGGVPKQATPGVAQQSQMLGSGYQLGALNAPAPNYGLNYQAPEYVGRSQYMGLQPGYQMGTGVNMPPHNYGFNRR